MSLAPGSHIGPYEVMAPIGKGGMGEVHRARDTNLGREVAIKVLPDALAFDPDRLARFEREARTLAALNHPNIAAVYGLETTDGIRALIMELVEGPTLAERIAVDAIPIDEALQIARQVSEALEAAHEHGIIHRDLKPANVKVRVDGTVKVLDFGLAKALEPADTPAGFSMSPTITTPAMTRAGIILGTAAYMSPEQARGRPLDRRTDIWAFGCVLFEMLSGRRPFADEETVSDTLASILKGDPAWDALPANTPPRIRTLLERCLRKDPHRRLSHIAEARIAIEEAPDDVTPVRRAEPSARRDWRLVWPVVAVLAGATSAALGAWIVFARVSPPVPARFEISAPPSAIPMNAADGRLLEVGDPISPDGRLIAFVAAYRGRPSIWVRPLDSPTARPLAGTEEAERPVWSTDSQALAFVAQGRLRRIRIAGGPAATITGTGARNLSWNAQNVILLGGEQGKPLFRVAADGGNLVQATTLTGGETAHDYPQFLPDGRSFLFMARRGSNAEDWDLYATRLDSDERRLIPGIHAAAHYSPTGHLLFVQNFQLMAMPFDLARLAVTGEPFLVSDGITAGPRATFSLSRNDTLAYLTSPPPPDSQLAWFDRGGNQAGTLGSSARHVRVRLSNDARLVAFDDGADILTFDVERGLTGKVVSLEGADFAPVFSPDGKALAFASSRVPATNAAAFNIAAGHLYTKMLGAVGDGEILFRSDGGKRTTDWSRDGRYVAFTLQNDVWALPMPQPPNAQPIRVTNTPFAEGAAVFAPDGKWIAYQSNDSPAGQEVYVQSFPDGGRRTPVSVGGGSTPRWKSDGSELFYVSLDSQLMSVSVRRSGEALAIGRPVALFQSRAFRRNPEYDVAADGRFLVTVPLSEPQDNSIAVIVNWSTTIKR